MRKTLPTIIVVSALATGIAFATSPNDNGNEQYQLTAIDDISRNTTVTVRGVVKRILDTDEFELSDKTGEIEVYIGWRNNLPVKAGDTVTVKGFVDDDWVKEIYAQEIIHADGRVTTFRQNN